MHAKVGIVEVWQCIVQSCSPGAQRKDIQMQRRPLDAMVIDLGLQRKIDQS